MRQEGLTTVAVILSPMPLCSASGKMRVLYKKKMLDFASLTNDILLSTRYLDQLGMSSVYDTKTYCRQSLIGGNYGLLNTTTFVPNPDYYRYRTF